MVEQPKRSGLAASREDGTGRGGPRRAMESLLKRSRTTREPSHFMGLRADRAPGASRKPPIRRRPRATAVLRVADHDARAAPSHPYSPDRRGRSARAHLEIHGCALPWSNAHPGFTGRQRDPRDAATRECGDDALTSAARVPAFQDRPRPRSARIPETPDGQWPSGDARSELSGTRAALARLAIRGCPELITRGARQRQELSLPEGASRGWPGRPAARAGPRAARPRALPARPPRSSAGATARPPAAGWGGASPRGARSRGPRSRWSASPSRAT